VRVEQLLRQQGRERRAHQRERVGPLRERVGPQREWLEEPLRGRRELPLWVYLPLLQPLYRQPPFFPPPEK
jgi:hypothetical protein